MKSKLPIEGESIGSVELGAMMREARENLGRELEVIAQDLRIQKDYLRAIEAGRLSDLPGTVYASGFVRAYSGYLGFDGEDILRRFRLAGDAINTKIELDLPSPAEDGRLPTSLIFLIGSIILIGAYGGWYLLSVNENQKTPMVAELTKKMPSVHNEETKLNEIIKSTPAIETAPNGSKKKRKISSQSRSLKADDVNPNSAITGSVTPAQASLNLEKPPTLSEEKKIGSELGVRKKLNSNGLRESAPVSELSQRVAIVGETAVQRSQSRSTLKKMPAISGSTNTIRIVVRAMADSFIAVRTKNNVALFSQMMRPGDRYVVPSGADLVLDTGNAGGLQISINEKVVPTLGSNGQIRRDIPLNAEKLLHGLN